MWKRAILTTLLLCGLLIFVSHHEHPLTPADSSDALSLKCPACVHGKVTIPNAAAELSLETTHEYLEVHRDSEPRSYESLSFGSRAPPVA